MKKDDKKKLKSGNIEELWKDLQIKLQEVAEEYKNLRGEIGDIDAFLKEVVNNVVVLLQEIHESISILEEKVAALERGAPLSSPQVDMHTQSTVPSSTQVQGAGAVLPVQEPVRESEVQKSREQPPIPPQQATRPIQAPTTPATTPPQQPVSEKPVAPISTRFEVISQLKQVLEERRKRLKRQ